MPRSICELKGSHPARENDSWRLLSGTAISLFLLSVAGFSGSAQAACTPAGPYGGGADTVTCNPGAGENISTASGTDQVTVTSGTVGTINTGAAADTVIVNGGTVTSIQTSTGGDLVTVNGGTVGTIEQDDVGGTAAIDTFTMTGGQVTSITQGGSGDHATISNGVVGSIDQGSGDDDLTINAGSTVTTVIQGTGLDSLIMTGGSATSIDQGSSSDSATLTNATVGTLDQGTGNDSLTINAGTTVTNVTQGDGFDTLRMTGGTVGALSQGGNLDMAYISGGRITGSFIDADYVQFSGGRIGDVDLVLGSNLFEMWGTAQIDTTLNSEQDADIYYLYGGSIGASVSTGSGNDTVVIGGTATSFDSSPITGVFGATNVGGNIILEGGNDSLTMNGGQVSGSIYGDGGAGHNNALSSDGFADTIRLLGGTVLGSVCTDSPTDGQVGIDGVTLNGTAVTGDILTYGGADIISLFSGSAANVYAGDDNDDILLSGAVISAAIDGGSGEDTINLFGGSAANVYGGDDDDEIFLSGAAIGSDIDGGGGDDGITWESGTVGTGLHGGTGSDTMIVSAASYDGTQILDGGDDSFASDGMVDRLRLLNRTVTANGASIINWETVSLEGTSLRIADGSWVVGDASDTTTGVSLASGSSLEGTSSLSLAGNLSVDSTSLFRGRGASEVTGNLVNQGTVTSVDGVAGDVIRVGRNYSGSGTYFVDADFTTNTADRLIIAGNVSGGPTSLHVNNVTSSTATGQDVIVVEVGGSSTADDFLLAGGPINAGAFTYDLEYGGNQFVLAAMLNATGEVYAAAPQAVINGLLRLPTLEQRVGTRMQAPAGAAEEAHDSLWGRIIGNRDKLALDGGPVIDSRGWGLQAGYDLAFDPGQNGQVVLGLTAQMNRMNADIRGGGGGGQLDSDSYGVGATATWHGHGGSYLDLQAQANRISLDLASALDGGLASGEWSKGYMMSAELGHRFALSESQAITPQAQLTWSHLDGASFTDDAGNAIDLGNNGQLTGRLGIAFNYKGALTDAGDSDAYVIANLLKDFEDSTRVQVGAADLDAKLGNVWAELGFGATIKWTENVSFYGEGSVRQSLTDSDNFGWAGTAGLRINW